MDLTSSPGDSDVQSAWHESQEAWLLTLVLSHTTWASLDNSSALSEP